MIILITITLASSNNTLPDDGDWNETCRSSWFQTFAVIGILYIFFWVFPRRQIVVGRRFGTLYQFHLQRLGVHCTPSLWRWNWYSVPKRRPTTIWRRGNTQKKIHNIHSCYLLCLLSLYLLFLKHPLCSALSAGDDINLLKPNDIYIYMSYRSANLQMLHFIYLFNKYTYWIF